MPDAPGLVVPVVVGPFFDECNVPFVPVEAPVGPVVEFLMPVAEPVELWADAAEAAARAKPAATKLMPMRFIVDLLMPGACDAPSLRLSRGDSHRPVNVTGKRVFRRRNAFRKGRPTFHKSEGSMNGQYTSL